jgi:hypothetical protein
MGMRRPSPVVGRSPTIVDRTKPALRPDSRVETQVLDTTNAITFTAKAVDARRPVNGMINWRIQNEGRSAKSQLS